MGKTNLVTRRSNFNVSSKHRNVTGNDAALKRKGLTARFFNLYVSFSFNSSRHYLEPVPIPVNHACNMPL